MFFFQYYCEMKKTNLGCHLLVIHFYNLYAMLIPIISNTLEK